MTTTFPSLCDESKSILLVVDVQTHLTAVMPAKVLARLQRNIGLLLNVAGMQNIPVLATEQYPEGLGLMEEAIIQLLPENTKRYTKTSFSCAGAENFVDDLKSSGRQQVIIAGMEAHICIMQTAIELLAENFDVYVVVDAICSRHRESYETALTRLRASGVCILDTEAVLFEWLRDAKNENFKSLQAMIR